jgi:hypothetical protein
MYWSPRRLMRPNRCLPPVDFLSRGETDPRRKFASTSERRRVSDGGRDGSGDERTDPWDRRQTLTYRVRFVPSIDPGIDLVDPSADGVQL